MRHLVAWAVLGLVACDAGKVPSPALPPEPPSPQPIAIRAVISPPTVSDLPAIDRPPPTPPSTRYSSPEEYKPPEPMPRPPEVLSFIRGHATGATPWKATVYELGDAASDGFGGYRVVSTRAVGTALTDELVEHLVNIGSYASLRCEGEPPLGVRLERDGASLSFVADCRLRIDGTRDVAQFSPQMLGFMRELDAKTAPCKWVRLAYFDLELCVDKTMRFGGGGDFMAFEGFAGCQQLTIGDSPLSRAKDMRRVGTVDVLCTPRDVPACAAICDSLRPTPNSTATASFPEGQPVIRSSTSGGIAGGETTIKIWRDGTVVFSGNRCDRLRGARAKISPDEVTQLLVKLAIEARFGQDNRPDCADCIYTRVVMGAGDDSVEVYGNAETLVANAVGANPC